MNKFTQTGDRLHLLNSSGGPNDPGNIFAKSQSFKKFETKFKSEANIASSNKKSNKKSIGSNNSAGGSVSGDNNGKAAMANAKRTRRSGKRKLEIGDETSSDESSAGRKIASIDKKKSEEEKDKKDKDKKDKKEEEEEVTTLAKAKRPDGFSEYDMAKMLDDIESNEYRYARQEEDTLFDIITKTYMRSGIKSVLFNKK